MRVMTAGTSFGYPSVHPVTGHIFLFMAVETELLRFRNEEKGETGAMGLVAYSTSAGGDRAVNILLVHLDSVTVQAEFLNRQYQHVRTSLMAADAKLGRVWTVHHIRPFFCLIPRVSLDLLDLYRFIIRIRHSVEEKTQHSVA